MYEDAKTNRKSVDKRLVFASSYITDIGVLRTPTVERPFQPISGATMG